MKASEAIVSLDAAIAEHGQEIGVRRGSGTPVTMMGFVRGYAAEQLVGLITQADRNVTLSPSTLGTFGIPKKADQVVISGALGTVQAVEEIRIGADLVRLNMVVRLT